MPSLFFPNFNALRLVLSSGLVPVALSRAPARARCDPHARLWLEVEELPSRECLAALSRIGVQALGGPVEVTETVQCWAELLPLRLSDAAINQVVWIGPDRQAAQFVARLRRSTPKPIGIELRDQPIERSAWIAIDRPSPRILAEAAELFPAFEAFAQQHPGIWVRLGHEHPLVEELVIPENAALVIRSPRTILVAGAIPTAEFGEYRLPLMRTRSPTGTVPPAIPVKFHLGQNRTGAARETLWVIPATEEFWSLCASVEERMLRRLEAATWETQSGTSVILRCPEKSHAPTFLPLSTVGYAADQRLPGLYVPANQVLRPQVRVRELADAFGAAPERIVWLGTAPDGELISHALPVQAFRPLSQLVVYGAGATVSLVSESRSEPFPLHKFVLASESIPTLDLEEPIPIAEAEIEPERIETTPSESGWFLRSLKRLMSRLNLDRDAEKDSEPETISHSTAPVERRVEQALSSPEVIRHGPDWTARRRSLEAALFQELPRLGSESRGARWAALASVYAKLANPVDAAVCWMNAVWETPANPPVSWLKQWLLAEYNAAKLPESQCVLERWLSAPRPGISRVVAAYTTVAAHTQPPAECVASLPRILAFLDQHFDDLPVRAAWLARMAAARICEGDALGLARWHDRVLLRLADRGPGLDLDEPSFLRFHGSVSGERFQAARKWLELHREKVRDWIRNHNQPGVRLGSDRLLMRYGLAAEIDATTSYADFMLAWGLGCLGERIQANDLAGKARKSLSGTTLAGPDSLAHAVLGDLFLHRVKDAQDGRSPRPGLPEELRVRFNSLPELARFAVDRLREHSQILEPRDHVRPYQGKDLKKFWGQDRLGERLAILANRAEPELAEEAEELLDVCARAPTTETVPRIVLTLLEVAPRLDPAIQVRLLNQLPTALDWLESWLSTLQWSASDRLERLGNYRRRMIRAGFSTAAWLEPGQAAPVIEQLLRQFRHTGSSLREPILNAAAQVFRAFRRLGFRSEAETLVQFLDPYRDAGEFRGLDSLINRLGLSIGWFTAGNEDAGWSILNEAGELLYLSQQLDINDRTRLAIAYAEALGFAPASIAHGRLGEIFERLERVKQTGSTNRWYTLKPLQLIDAVVRSVVTDEFALGQSVRNWLDDDEFLIRGRIHRDLAAVLREQGIG